MSRLIVAIITLVTFSVSQASEVLAENAHDCFIVPNTLANVGSAGRGVVERLLVNRGDTVVQGQPIAELDSGNEQIMVAHAEARSNMQSEIAAREADVELAKLEVGRIAVMHKQQLASIQELDEARARKKVAQAGLVQSLENRKLLLIELQRANHDLAQRTLRSPTNGVVVDQFIFPGEFIYDEPIMSIAALDLLRVEVILPSRFFGSINLNSVALISPEMNKDQLIEATVDVVDALLDTRSGTFGVRLLLPNNDFDIIAGQKCTVQFQKGSAGIELAEEAK